MGKMNRTVEFKFVRKHYGREGIVTVVISHTDWNPTVSEWLWPAIEQFARLTSLSPPSITVWDTLRHAIPGLADVFSWQGFTEIPVSDLELEDVRDLFMDIDDTYHWIWGADRGALRSAAIRKFISRYLDDLRPDGQLHRAKFAFQPKGRANTQPRALISDLVVHRTGGVKEPPLGASSHSTVAELKRQARERLQADLDLITAACLQELSEYDKACAAIDRIRLRPIDIDSERRALEKVRGTHHNMAKRVAQLTQCERDALIAYYVRADYNVGASFSPPPDYQGSDDLAVALCATMGIRRERFLKCVRYRYYPRQTVYVAAILILQCATAWNVSSVMEMTTLSVRTGDGGRFYSLQSVKTRARDDTPLVVIEGDDSPAVIAIRFALGRLQSLKDRGWATADEVGLWLGPRSNYESGRGKIISNLNSGLRALQEKYKLPRFSFEQIRPQKLTAVSLEKGPIFAAELAGHSGLGSIGGYIDHLINRRINSAVNLEFQKRWETEISMRESGDSPHLALMPVGDGASCTDSANPPDESWLNAGVCDGRYCHAAGGCPNRVVKVDAARIVEVELTRDYYLKNWQRLYANNPEAFAVIHLPKIEFNAGLFQYIKSGPYRHLLHGL